jgi:hypothetical protein
MMKTYHWLLAATILLHAPALASDGQPAVSDAFYSRYAPSTHADNKAYDTPKTAPDAISGDRELPSILEVIGGNGITADTIQKLCETDAPSYRWNNHLLLYGTLRHLRQAEQRIKASFPSAVVHVYAKPFYVFDRRQCADGEQPGEWSHTIMSAQLVADTTMQAEYMDYHARQTELFPEVGNGFCNADFGQVLVYRSGRQLMLVISIPEGRELDELNPKTTENNPRVDEWNVLMANYQTALLDAGQDMVWITFNK